MADTITSPDKFKHFAVCLVASILNPLFALGLAFGKEYGDSKAVGNKWSWLDILFDILGCAVGMAIHLWIFKSINF